MRKGWLYATGLVCLMAACTGTPQSSADGLCSIDVAGAMEKPAESCLIGGNPNILLLDKQIAVVSGKNCFLFDKETGKFLTKVGHVGEDPEAYSGPAPTYNDVDGLLYFMRRPATLQKYDMQGKYRGKLTIPTPPASPGYGIQCPFIIVFQRSGRTGRYGSQSVSGIAGKGRAGYCQYQCDQARQCGYRFE